MAGASFDIAVVGHGAAGLTAALAAAEASRSIDRRTSIAVIERAARGQHGGNTRFTPCYMRMEAPDRLSPDFVSEMISVSDGQNDPAYFQRLASDAPTTIGWLETHGIEFHTPCYYLSAGPARIQPIGGGESIVRELTRAAENAGVQFLYEREARTLMRGTGGGVVGVTVAEAGRDRVITASAVILASGGFQGSPDMLEQHLGYGAGSLVPISPGTRLNSGAGIRMALAAGALPSGDWQGMHIEPIDPRASNPAPVVLVYPYGVVVDQYGARFFDEGGGLVHETWEQFARYIHFDTPGRQVYAVLDSRLNSIENFGRAIRSEVAPYEARTLAELAQLIAVPADDLEKTVLAYNSACVGDASQFDATVRDGLATDPKLMPPKSNWARTLDVPPFYAWPLIGGIAYTFGGIATDVDGRVLGSSGAIPGLYAAGEVTGHFHGTAPNAVSVMRALVYGRLAGRCAVRDAKGSD
jgi:tricarballylate dehydrogenase